MKIFSHHIQKGSIRLLNKGKNEGSFPIHLKQLQHEVEHSSPYNGEVNASSFATAQSPTCFGHTALEQGKLCTFNTSTFKYRC
jgi:hypothetical protein